MTRGLFAGAFWGLLTGGLVLLVAALVLDHRAAQPVPVPTFLANIEDAGPIASLDIPFAPTRLAALRTDPVIDAETRQNRRLFEIAPTQAPLGLQGVARAPFDVRDTIATRGLQPVSPPEALRVVVPNQDAELVRTRPRALDFPESLAAGSPLEMVAPLPQFSPTVVQKLSVPEAPQAASTIVALPQSTGDLTRSEYSTVSATPLVMEPPVAPKDAQVSAPKGLGMPSPQALSQAPEVVLTEALNASTSPQGSPPQVTGPSVLPSVELSTSQPRVLTDPPQIASGRDQIGEVTIILLSDNRSAEPIPDWAAAVAGSITGAAVDRPVLLPLAPNASSEQVAQARAQLRDGGDVAGLIVLPLVASETAPSDELSDLIEQTPLVFGAAGVVPFAPKIQPVYRWSAQTGQSVRQDLEAAQARAYRDGNAVVVVQDSPAARAAVEAWQDNLDPMTTKIAPLPYSGS